jgi:hypothetical protein
MKLPTEKDINAVKAMSLLEVRQSHLHWNRCLNLFPANTLNDVKYVIRRVKDKKEEMEKYNLQMMNQKQINPLDRARSNAPRVKEIAKMEMTLALLNRQLELISA